MSYPLPSELLPHVHLWAPIESYRDQQVRDEYMSGDVIRMTYTTTAKMRCVNCGTVSLCTIHSVDTVRPIGPEVVCGGGGVQ